MSSSLQFYNTAYAPFARKFGLSPADRIVEPIFQTGLSKHHAIYLGIDEHGNEWVAENQMFAGVRIVLAQNYFKQRGEYSVEPFFGKQEERVAAVVRALQLLRQRYNLVFYNCEHYASYVQTGRAHSKQVLQAACFVGLFFLIGAIISGK